jgi:hypothetical protein
MPGPKFRGWVLLSRSGRFLTRSSVYTLRRITAGPERLVHVVRFRGSLIRILDTLGSGRTQNRLIDDRLRVWITVKRSSNQATSRAHTQMPSPNYPLGSAAPRGRFLRWAVGASGVGLAFALAAVSLGPDPGAMVGATPSATPTKPAGLATPQPIATQEACFESPASDSEHLANVAFGGVAVSVNVIQAKVEQTLVLTAGCWMPLGK